MNIKISVATAVTPILSIGFSGVRSHARYISGQANPLDLTRSWAINGIWLLIAAVGQGRTEYKMQYTISRIQDILLKIPAECAIL